MRAEMSLTEQDFITLQEAAKRLNISLDQVMFLIENGRFRGFYEPPESRKRRIFDYHPPEFIFPAAPGTKGYGNQQLYSQKWFRWFGIKLPIKWQKGEATFVERTIYDEHFKTLSNEKSTYHPFACPIESIMLIVREVDAMAEKAKHRAHRKEDALDLVIHRAVKNLNEKGVDWHYNDVIKRIGWLSNGHDDEVSRLVEGIKGTTINWKEGAWVKESTAKGTIQNKLSKLYPKTSRKPRK